MVAPLVKGYHSDIFIPNRVHIPAADGGHLIIKPRRHVLDTTDLPFNEANELHVMKLIAKRILTEAFDADIVHGGIGTFNYQENGNWSLHLPDHEQHAHIHVYGRGREAKTQPYGNALDFSRFEENPDFEGYRYCSPDISYLLRATRDVLACSDLPIGFHSMNRQWPWSTPLQPEGIHFFP